MNERIQWIEHKGKKIIYLDYKNLNSRNKEEFIKVLDAAKEFVLSAGNNILLLVDIRNSFGDRDIVNRMKQDGKEEKPYIKKEAVVGITGVKEVLLKAINLFTNLGIKPFNSLEEAKDWLVE